ncbi:MAG: glycosyltransferase, partial [Rikenellaceae bacterium]
YACEPNLGSEIGVGWHWVLEMSRYFDLWVLTRESNRKSIEEWFARNGHDHPPTFIYYDLPKKWRWWKKGLRGVRIYYLLWQHFTNKIVKRTMQQNGIEIYHHLTYGNALWSVSRYGKSQKFIWGPTSAGNCIDRDFSKHYTLKGRLKEWAQRLMAAALRYNWSFKSRCRHAALILCKTEQTRLLVAEKYRAKAVVFTDVAVELFDAHEASAPRSEDGIVRYLAVGRLEGWRGFDLLIEAMTIATKTNDRVHLDILGAGEEFSKLKRLIAKRGLQSHVTLRGQVSREEYLSYMAQCDVVVNPSLKEGAVTTAFDSLTFAKPLICVDSGGYTKYFSDEYAVVLRMESRARLIQHLAMSILRLSQSSLREKMAEKIVDIRGDFTWERKGEEIRDIIIKYVRE